MRSLIRKFLALQFKQKAATNFNFQSAAKARTISTISILIMLIFILPLGIEAQPNIGKFEKWLNAGSFHNWYSSIGHEREEDGPIRRQQAGWRWPGYYLHQDMQAAKGLWIGCRNYTEPELGTTFEYKTVHCGPRPYTGGLVEFFPIEFKHYAKFPPTEVYVDGVLNNHPDEEVVIDEIDSSMPYDQMIYNYVNTQVGLSMERKIYQFSNQYYDNVHVMEYTFINTGNIDADEEIERTEGTLEDVYFYFQNNIAILSEVRILFGDPIAWGRNTLNNEVGPYPAGGNDNLRYSYAWHGYFETFLDWNNIGGPIWEPDQGFGARINEADTVGRLGAAQFAGTLTLFAQNGSDINTDDPNQPSTTGYEHFNSPLNFASNAFDPTEMQARYEMMIKGHPTESHANFITGGDFAGSQENPGTGSVDNAGYVYVNGYGPYTIGYGDSVKIILVEGASGLSRDESIRIGKLYKSGNISVLEKNNWVLTGADSLRQTFERITDAFDNNWNIPQAPYPPETFSVNSNQGKVDLEWTTFSEGPTIQGFEIYRNTQEQVDGYVSDVWFSKYELIAELGAEIREYTDTTQSLNIPVHYYIVSVGDEVPANVNLNIPAHTLKSNRSYTQTYLPAHRLVVSVDEPENVLREFQLNQNYPNPFNPVTTITYTIPQTGFVQLKVYDLLGREAANLVSEEQTAGSYKVEFDASSLSSGIYFYRLQSGSFMDFKKLTLLR